MTWRSPCFHGPSKHLADLILQATRTVARLLRARHSFSCAASAALSGDTAGGFSGAFTHILDEIATELGFDPKPHTPSPVIPAKVATPTCTLAPNLL